MKRSEFIKRVLRSRRNTVFTTKEQVEVALKIFESLGILPPYWIPEDHGYTYGDEPSGEPNGFGISVNKWEPEDE